MVRALGKVVKSVGVIVCLIHYVRAAVTSSLNGVHPAYTDSQSDDNMYVSDDDWVNPIYDDTYWWCGTGTYPDLTYCNGISNTKPNGCCGSNCCYGDAWCCIHGSCGTCDDDGTNVRITKGGAIIIGIIFGSICGCVLIIWCVLMLWLKRCPGQDNYRTTRNNAPSAVARASQQQQQATSSQIEMRPYPQSQGQQNYHQIPQWTPASSGAGQPHPYLQQTYPRSYQPYSQFGTPMEPPIAVAVAIAHNGGACAPVAVEVAIGQRL